MHWRVRSSMVSVVAVSCGGVSEVETSTSAEPDASTEATGPSLSSTSEQDSESDPTSATSSSTVTGGSTSVQGTETSTTTQTGVDESATGGSSSTTGGSQLHGWTEQLSPSDVWPVIAPATQAVQLVVDPHATSRLALRVTDFVASSGWAIWDDGEVFGPELDESFTYSDGAGFDSEGRFTAAYEVDGDIRLMHWTGAGGPWHGVTLLPESAFFDWPPGRLSVGMGAPARSLVHSDEALWHSTPWTFTPEVDWSIGIFCSSNCNVQGVLYRPGSADELIVTTATGMIMGCVPDFDILWSCAEIGAAPTTDLRMWMTLANPDLLIMRAQGELFISSDAGATFASAETPTDFFDIALSPEDPQRIVIWSSSGTEPLFVTDDLGQTWSPLPLPETDVHSLTGVGIDGAGTLFTLRGGGLFSHPGNIE